MDIRSIVSNAYLAQFKQGPITENVYIIYDESPHILSGPDILCDLISIPIPGAKTKDLQELCLQIASRIVELRLNPHYLLDVSVRLVIRSSIGATVAFDSDEGQFICTNQWSAPDPVQ